MEVAMGFARLCLASMVLAVVMGGCGDDESGTAGSGGGGSLPTETYAGNICVGAKQETAGTFCDSVLQAWSTWNTNQDDDARDTAVEVAASTLAGAWSGAEEDAEVEDASCSDLALTSAQAEAALLGAIEPIVQRINDGLDLSNAEEAQCGASVLAAAGTACSEVLAAEAAYIADLATDPDGTALASAMAAAYDAFSASWSDATAGGCPTNATEEAVRGDLESAVAALVRDTIVTPGLADDQYTTLIPGPTSYRGRTVTPRCMDDSEYRYFARRGTVNKLVMYYQGGGACWNRLTCGVPSCTTSTQDLDLNDLSMTGLRDLTNPDNPFRDWNIVFVSYCTCDIHYGDATVEYGDLTVEHVGYQNAQVAEKFAREHFLNPEVVFVTGSSAGSYGAWLNAPRLHQVWPASQIHVLGDAGNGVITTDFLRNEFSAWSFTSNLPDIPGVLEAITDGEGIPDYSEAVADFFPDTNWAHYSTLYDGGLGGQTGFFNIMLNDGNPLAATTWWDASCEFGATAVSQSEAIFSAQPSNYRYYFGTGSRHTMWGSNKVYDDTTGNVPTIVDWINGMLASSPEGKDPAWTNVLCENCSLLLEGDPRPDPPEPPFEVQGDDIVVVCE